MPPVPGWLQVALVTFSVVMFIGTLIAVPYLIVRLPPDYFVRPPVRRSFAVHAARNVVGTILVVLGLAMLVLPGQGLLTILIGLSILDLPSKRRLVYRILSQPKVDAAIQGLRKKAGRPPLEIPDAD